MSKPFISAFILATILPVFAGSVNAQKPKVNCANASTTVEMKYCSQISYTAADKKLNQVYKQVSATIKGEQKQLLVSGQTAWIKFRDNSCDFEVYPSRGGTGYEIFRNGCLERLTQQRTKDLQNYLAK